MYFLILFSLLVNFIKGFPGGTMVKKLPANSGFWVAPQGQTELGPVGEHYGEAGKKGPFCKLYSQREQAV